MLHRTQLIIRRSGLVTGHEILHAILLFLLGFLGSRHLLIPHEDIGGIPLNKLIQLLVSRALYQLVQCQLLAQAVATANVGRFLGGGHLQFVDARLAWHCAPDVGQGNPWRISACTQNILRFRFLKKIEFKIL